MTALAFGTPSPLEVIIILLVLALPIIGVVVAFRIARGERHQPAFPVQPLEPPTGSGRYRVVGVDKTTRADREITIEAASPANAQVKAELDGMVVTSVTKSS